MGDCRCRYSVWVTHGHTIPLAWFSPTITFTTHHPSRSQLQPTAHAHPYSLQRVVGWLVLTHLRGMAGRAQGGTQLALPKFGSVRFRPPFVRTWTWTSYKISEPEPNPNCAFGSGSNLLNLVIFSNHIFQFFFASKRFETHVRSLQIRYLCKAVAQTTFDKPYRYYTTIHNKYPCRKATQNMAVSDPGEGLINYIKMLK